MPKALLKIVALNVSLICEQEGIVQEKIQEQIEETEPGSEEPIYETEEEEEGEEVDWTVR